MDPNATLAEMVKLADQILRQYDGDQADGDALIVFDATRLAELVQALDGWMRKGGFPPRAWSKERIFRKIAPPI